MTLDHKHPAAESRRDGQTRFETNTQALHNKFDRLLAKAKPTKRELIQQCFRDLYPKLEVSLSKGTPLKDLINAFNELAGAKVCARTFNEMLLQERGRRDQEGNSVFCENCGNRLNRSSENDIRAPSEPAALHGGASLNLEQ